MWIEHTYLGKEHTSNKKSNMKAREEREDHDFRKPIENQNALMKRIHAELGVKKLNSLL